MLASNQNLFDLVCFIYVVKVCKGIIFAMVFGQDASESVEIYWEVF